jgi:hypothetical protein
VFWGGTFVSRERTFALLLGLSVLFGCSAAGDIELNPSSEMRVNKQLGQDAIVAILDFSDKRFTRRIYKRYRFKPKKNLVGVFFGAMSIRVKTLYSDQAITDDVTDAIEFLFGANGFQIKKSPGRTEYSPSLKERLTVNGQINEFLIEGYPSGPGTSPSIVATIDIDLLILDTPTRKSLWKGKIVAYRKMGANRGIFTNTEKIFTFFNDVFSDAVERAWLDGGIRKALEGLDKKPFSKSRSL